MVKKIKHWSKTFGLSLKTEKKIPSDSAFDLSLISEEFKETFQAAAENDLVEYEDGLGDLLWVTIRAMLNAGIDPEKTIEKIYLSNMSKLDLTIEDCKKTKDYYLEKGIETIHVPVAEGFVVRDSFTKKVLKSHLFKKPKFN
jgi:NTP pyrophosphatase (non-canonical NTP hydrolase)